MNSIPWVRCASGNVYFFNLLYPRLKIYIWSFVIISLISFHAYSEIEAARVIVDFVDDVRHLFILSVRVEWILSTSQKDSGQI